MHQLAQRPAGGVEALQRLVDVVGQQPARDRADRQLRVLLIDAGLDRWRGVQRSRVDESQREPGRPLEARREGESRRAGGVAVGGCDLQLPEDRVRDVQEPAERVHDSEPADGRGATGEQSR